MGKIVGKGDGGQSWQRKQDEWKMTEGSRRRRVVQVECYILETTLKFRSEVSWADWREAEYRCWMRIERKRNFWTRRGGMRDIYNPWGWGIRDYLGHICVKLTWDTSTWQHRLITDTLYRRMRVDLGDMSITHRLIWDATSYMRRRFIRRCRYDGIN